MCYKQAIKIYCLNCLEYIEDGNPPYKIWQEHTPECSEDKLKDNPEPERQYTKYCSECGPVVKKAKKELDEDKQKHQRKLEESSY